MNDIETFESFDDMGLKEEILRGLYAYGFEKPSMIQQKAVVQMAKGKDIIAQSQSGTGKTGAFVLGMLQKLDISLKKPQVLILSPTRELSQQIFTCIESLGTYMDISPQLLIGGKNISDDYQKLDKGSNIIVGTPGRVYDMLKRYVLVNDHLTTFILDEADEMLSRGFKDQIYEIFQYLPKNCQVALFSATMPVEALEITSKFMTDAVQILVKNDELTLDGIKQFYVAIQNESWKYDSLCDIYSSISVAQTIIYCNSKRKAEWLQNRLAENEFSTTCLHGDLRQDERDAIIRDFRGGQSRILIATDIIARGIDVQQVSLVINYDVPRYREVYIHRIGRSGRFGRKGVAINFVTQDDIRSMKEIEKFYSTHIQELPNNFGEILQA